MSGPSGSGEDAADHNVEVWKIKRLIKSLEMARGLVISSFLIQRVICLKTEVEPEMFKIK